jgi:hypothetical protein
MGLFLVSEMKSGAADGIRRKGWLGRALNLQAMLVISLAKSK